MRNTPWFAILSPLLIIGCAPVDGASARRGVVDGSCSDDGLDRFVGQKVTAQLGATLLDISGAKTLRWGGPGMAMTMDFRADRLTVGYDEGMRLTSARCG
ncbi:I78 family peptidase inhibitor [Sphingobium sp. AN641]|uniref:I78 family peptidase inhibitor n=1 Tax=Sphingobium sp. AN641 TaxID=3133443 RepID=UPI0030BF78A6